MGKVESTQDAVVEDIKKDIGVEHIVRSERTTYFRCTYTWSTQYAKEKYEQQRTIHIPEGVDNNVLYAYQTLTNIDLCHMVIFNAYVQGKMGEEEFLEILRSSKVLLEKVLPYIKLAKKLKLEVYEEIIAIYTRVKKELEENNLWK